ncbi:MAG: hypothetical protein QXL51_00960 [Candidatus Aenigmatarchaeota archaeon]
MRYPEYDELYKKVIEASYGSRTLEEVKAMAKADAPILSNTTGFFNAVYGAQVFQQLNTSSTLFGVLPKFPYQRSGFRAQTTRFVDSGVGAAENATIGTGGIETVKPTLVQVNVGIKEQAVAFEFSQRMKLLANTKDDAAFDVANILEAAKQSFIYAIDTDMNQNVTTTASANIESIDRVVSSYSEVHNCTDVDSNDADIYGLDRDMGASWADAYVSHNSATNRPISDAIVRELIANTVKAGANPSTQIWYTGTDTYEQLVSLYQTQMRYAGPEIFKARTNVNDGEAGGINFGMEMGTLYGRPIYVAPAGKVAASGGAGKISNLYLLDIGIDPVYNEPKLGIKVLQAPITIQTNMENYPAHQKLGNKYLLYSAMELECKRFNIQGKARDLEPIA